MLKTHDLKSVIVNFESVSFFYLREKNDANGNPRFRVYMIDPDAPAVYENIFKCYESQIPEYVKNYLEKYVYYVEG